MRKLIYVPIIHTEVDMGSMAEPLKREFILKFGKEKWVGHVRAVDELWDGIRRKIKALQLDAKRVRVYQDGLPICGRELEIVREVARLGSKNYQIVLGLVERGALLEGTENPKFLVQEYLFVKKLTGITDPKEKKSVIERSRRERDSLLNQRDRFIGHQIRKTLKPGETGLLFSGIEHKIERYLPKEIKITYLIYRLPFKRLGPLL